MKTFSQFTLTLLLVTSISGIADEGQVRILELEGQPLASSLREVANAFELQLAFHSETATGFDAPKLAGEYTEKQALTTLLADTGLEYQFVTDSSVVVRPKNAQPRGRTQPTSSSPPVAPGPATNPSPQSSPAPQDESSGDAAETDVEEIVVTARRREELIKDVPQQITLFTSDEISNALITSYQDFANLTPNFQTFANFRKGVFNITVRGIPTVQGGEAPVTVLVDGVQVAGLDFINQDLFDLESIQVLRGPQGAIYGRGAIGGTILINTNKPTNEFESSIQGTYTTEIDEYRIVGALGGPIVEDKAQFRLSVSHADREGFIDNSLAGGKCDFVEETIVRGRLSFQPTEKLSVEAKAVYLDGYTWATCMNFSTDDDPFLGNGDNFPTDLPRDFKQLDDRQIQTYALTFDYEASLGTLTSATSYQNSESFSPGDVDFGPIIQPVFFENPVDVEAWNTDLHFVSESRGAFSWIVGGFYQDRTTKNFLIVGFGPPPIQPPFFVDSIQEDISKASAVYGELIYQPSDRSEFSFALRYDEDERESQDLNVSGSFIEETFSGWQPRGSFKYDWNENVMAYASIGTGFRSGGFNSLADTIAVGLTERKFEKETATTYEVGVKGVSESGLFNFSAAIFRTDFDNQQFFFVDTANVARIVYTIPKTRINGVELELNFNPAEGLDLRAALGVADGMIKDGGEFAPDDGHSPNSHGYTFNLIGQYLTPISDTVSLRLRLEYERRGPIYYDPQNTFKFPSTDFVNAYVGFEWDRFSVSMFGRNLTDERIPTFFGVDANGPGVHGFFQNLPRTFGIQAAARF